MGDPLDILFHDDIPHPDLEALTSILQGRVSLERESERVAFLVPYHDLTLRLQLLVFLLARKALYEMDIANEAMKPGDIALHTGIKGNSVRPNLIALKGVGLLAQDREGAYYVPNAMVPRVAAMLAEGA